VYASSGWCGCGTQVGILQGGGIRSETRGWPRVQLAQVLDTTNNVPAYVIGVVGLQLRSIARMASQHQVTKARCVAFDLRLDRLRHVNRGPVRDVAVRPGGVLPMRSA